ncbi:MAG: hypothetical protein JF606_26005 [Burkholderiales bacterium]|jgi:hypothetical protein|nr:hypothetical protein [Burkholderiales bacterium]
MSNAPVVIAWRAGLRCIAALATTIVVALSFAACESTARFSSRVVNKPAQELKSINLVLVENDFRAPGLAVSDKRDERLLNYGYFELGRLLKDRAPALLAANGLRGAVRVFPQPKAGDAVDLGAVNPNDAILLLQVKSGREVKQNLALHRSYLDMVTTLLDMSATGSGRKTLWASQVSFRLGADEAMGVLLIHRVDAEFVDTLVIGLLNNMAADGIIVLPQGKAVRPKAT